MTSRIICFAVAVCLLIFTPLIADELQQRREEGRRDIDERRHVDQERRESIRDGERDASHARDDVVRRPRSRRDSADEHDEEEIEVRRRINNVRRNEEEDDHRRHQHNAMQRIEHVHTAAEHLEMAGEHEMSRDLHHRAEEMERDLRHGDQRDGVHMAIRELQEQVALLKKEVRELRQRIGER